MTEYVVRLRNYEGKIVDGKIYAASTGSAAKESYLLRCKQVGIIIGKYDHITVEPLEDIANNEQC